VDGHWQKVKGCATDIAFGGDESFFKLGCNEHASGFHIYKWHEPDGWRRFSQAGGVSLTVDEAGDPWVVNNRKTVFKYDAMDERWLYMGLKNKAEEIAAGAGSVYAIAGSE
jgi:hypothetical protein